MKADIIALSLVLLVGAGGVYALFRENPSQPQTFNSTTFTSSEREGKPFYWFNFEGEEFFGAVLIAARYHYIGEIRKENKMNVLFSDMNGGQDLSVPISQNQIILITEDGSRSDVSESFVFSDTPMEIEKGRFQSEIYPELEVFNSLLTRNAN